jgi:hypothetical protein
MVVGRLDGTFLQRLSRLWGVSVPFAYLHCGFTGNGSWYDLSKECSLARQGFSSHVLPATAAENRSACNIKATFSTAVNTCS